MSIAFHTPDPSLKLCGFAYDNNVFEPSAFTNVSERSSLATSRAFTLSNTGRVFARSYSRSVLNLSVLPSTGGAPENSLPDTVNFVFGGADDTNGGKSFAARAVTTGTRPDDPDDTALAGTTSIPNNATANPTISSTRRTLIADPRIDEAQLPYEALIDPTAART
ncbi:MAG: hypothetical protein U0V73_14495 [Acidimicrobiia bacterium]